MSEQKGPEPSVTMSGSRDEVTDEAVLGGFVSYPSSMEYTECPISLCNSLCSLSQEDCIMDNLLSDHSLHF